MAAALALHLELEVTESEEFRVETELPVSKGRQNLCVQAFEQLHSADGFTFRIRSEIPLAGGLRSRPPAVVAGGGGGRPPASAPPAPRPRARPSGRDP